MRSLGRVAAAAALSLALSLSSTAQGQSVDTQLVTVRGVVYDSLRGRPLVDALVLIGGVPQTAMTDVRGRFRIDSVPAGVRNFIVHHPSLDTVGLVVLNKRAVVASGHEIAVTLPSFATVWRALCPTEPRPDSGIVFGTIRSVTTRSPVARASVDLSWIETSYDRDRGVRQRRIKGEIVSNSRGGYAMCGVPLSHWLRVEARDSSAGGVSGGTTIPPTDYRVQRRDLLIGPQTRDSTNTGRIVGLLTDGEGFPFSDARVVLDDSTVTRSNGEGRFAFRDVRAGTRLVEIQSIGMVPVIVVVDVFPGDTASITRELRRVTTLDVVRVTGTRRGQKIAQALEERRRSGFGYTMDMTEVQAYTSFANALNEFPAIRLDKRNSGDYRIWVSDGRGGECEPAVWVDGARMAIAAVNMIAPKDVIAVELFPRASTVPIEFRRNENLMTCGALMVWTTWAFSR